VIERLALVLGDDDLASVLARDVRVRLVNISGSGCLVETSAQVEPGTTGVLTVDIDGEQYADDIRVARVQRVHGSSATWHVGAEFLWTTYPGSRSLRRVASRLQREVAQQAVTIDFGSHCPN
jgi:PilZ domain